MGERIRNILQRARRPFLRAGRVIRRRIEGSLVYRMIDRHPLGGRMLHDILFRAGAFLHLGLLFGFLYGAVQLLTALCYRSAWLGALGSYHILLAAIQLLLARYIQKNGPGRDPRGEWLRYRLCGAVLLFMTPVLASILVLIEDKNSHSGYPGFLIYVAAVYAFWKIGTAISNARKFRKYGSPVLCAAKDVSLIATLVSVLSLETAVLYRYGGMPEPAFYRGILGTVGGAVCVFALGKAAAMVVLSSRRLKKPSRPALTQRRTPSAVRRFRRRIFAGEGAGRTGAPKTHFYAGAGENE